MMTLRFGWGLLLWLGITSWLFAQPRGPLKAYFFPYHNFTEAKIYRYVNLDDPNDIIYQLCSTYVEQQDTLLMIKRFNDRFQELETLVQVIRDSGVYLQDYQLYVAGKLIQGRVIHDDVYQWRLSKKQSIKWSARFESVYGSESFRKKRRLIMRPGPYFYEDRRYKAISFAEDFRHSVKNNYGIHTSDFSQVTLYAKGLGLVAYDRTLASGKKLRYELDKILDLDQWKARRRRPPTSDVPLKRT